MKLLASWTLPVRTMTEGKTSEHWTKKSKRHKVQQLIVRAYLKDISKFELPLKVLITRIAPRKLDSADNLGMSLKWIIDAVCDMLIPGLAAGRADSDPRITLKVDQEKGQPKQYAVKIEFYEPD